MQEIWLYTIISVLLVSFISFIGMILFYLKEEKLKKILLFLVSFSAGALLGDAFIHLLPEIVEKFNFRPNISLNLLLGILTFFVLEKFIFWRHCHLPTSKEHPHPIVFMNLIGDALHNFIDGAIIGGGYLASIHLGITTTIAIIFHEIPQEIGDMGVLLYGGFSKIKVLVFNFLSSLTALAGAILTIILAQEIGNFSLFLIPFTAGGFIYIAGSDLIPELHKETKVARSLIQLIGLILGIGIMLLLS